MVNEIFREVLVPKCDFIFGFADLKGLLPDLYSEYRYGISIGKRLNPDIVDELFDGPTMEYHQHYIELNQELQELSEKIAGRLNELGFEATSIRPSVTTEELDTIYSEDLRTPVSHKMVATRAGLGWIGKTDLFVSNEFGPRLRLVTILTKEKPGPPGTPIDESQCGSCEICVDECPAEAATGQAWDISIDRDEFFDPQKCREQCRIFGAERLKSDIRICGICVAVCPQG